MSDSNDITGSGWKAIDEALQEIYGSQKPHHWAALLPASLGGKDPLQGISAYLRDHPVPHWHYVTFGFSELYDKESDDPAVSGWGFELTFRLITADLGAKPPTWVFNFLQNLARYVFGSRRVFNSGDYFNANGPIALGEDTEICALAFVPDPELLTIDTPNGTLQFLQIVGLTEGEELALKQWDTLKAMEVFLPHIPLYTTDLGRASLLLQEEIRQTCLQGATRDGSNTAGLFVDQLSFDIHDGGAAAATAGIVLGAKQVEQLVSIMPYRLRFGHMFGLWGQEAQIWFRPGDFCAMAKEENQLTLTLSLDVMERLCQFLQAKRGTYPCPGWQDLTIEIRPTFIRDQAGEVVTTVG